MFIQKLDDSGNLIWVKQMGGTLNDIGRDIVVDEFGSVYVNGYFRDTINVESYLDTTTLISNGFDDIFIQKLDASGNAIWTHSAGSHSQDRSLGIALDGLNNIYTTGYFNDTVDFNFGSDIDNHFSAGQYDIFIQKLNQCFLSVIDEQESCEPFTWIDGITYTSTNNEAVYILTDINGCDSIIQLNLNIPLIDTTITEFEGVLTAEESNATYQWLDCNNNYEPIANETEQNYYVNEYGTYAVEITKGLCRDTSECRIGYPIGLEDAKPFNSIVVYPNPTKGHVIINTIDLDDVFVDVFNPIGQKVYSVHSYSSNRIEFNLPESKGLYIIKISNNVQSKHYKLLKE